VNAGFSDSQKEEVSEMNDMDYRIILGELVEIKKRLDSLEQASTPRANSEQSVVARPDAVDSENPALARPATIAKIVTFLESRVDAMMAQRSPMSPVVYVMQDFEKIIQWLKYLDQGPIAKSSQGDELYEAALEYFRSRIRQQ
jgi:hypothetical protein